MSFRSRPVYVERKLALERARRQHLRQAPEGCRCIWCIGPEGVQRAVDEILAAQSERVGPPPF